MTAEKDVEALEARYPSGVLRLDYLRGAAGLAVTGGPFALAMPHPVLAVPLVLGFLLFGAFSLRTLARHLTRYTASSTGLATRGPFGASIPWADVRDVRLRYYSIRRDRKEGWMQLTVTGGGRRIDMESGLDRFEEIAARVAEIALANRLRLTEATRDNFLALGHAIPDPDARPGGFKWGRREP